MRSKIYSINFILLKNIVFWRLNTISAKFGVSGKVIVGKTYF